MAKTRQTQTEKKKNGAEQSFALANSYLNEAGTQTNGLATHNVLTAVNYALEQLAQTSQLETDVSLLKSLGTVLFDFFFTLLKTQKVELMESLQLKSCDQGGCQCLFCDLFRHGCWANILDDALCFSLQAKK